MNRIQKLLLSEIAGTASFKRVAERLAQAMPGERIALKGLRASSFSAVASAMACGTAAELNGGSTLALPLILLVTANNDHSGEIYDDLQFFGVERTFHFPKSQELPFDSDEPLLEEQIKHLEFLNFLATQATISKGSVPVCVSSVESLFTRVAPLAVMQDLASAIQWGEPLDVEDFSRRAVDLGYERVSTVEGRGEFAIRGGIVDVFPLNTENPLRIDLFGDEIESLRWFDVHTQRSLKNQEAIEHVALLPARERVLVDFALARGNGAPLPTLLDILPAGSLVMLDNPEMFNVLEERFQQLVRRQFAEHSVERADLPKPETVYATLADVEKATKRFVQVHHSLILEAPGARSFAFETSSFETAKPSLEHYITQIRKRLADGYRVMIVCDNTGQAQRMDEMLRENEIGAVEWFADQPGADGGSFSEHDVIVTTGLLHSGFIFGEASLYVVTDREIFGRYKRRHVYRKIYKGVPIADAREIRKGDFVVHIEHGIGRFEGIRTQRVDGRVADLIELTYADNDRLLVPVEKIAYVQKFSGPEQAPPSLDKLGGKKWAARRKKSEEDIEKLAEELLRLYARREVSKGYHHGEDTLWQREFESSFLYTETPDQLRAIEEVKRDMGTEKPMDRLVCGDVGYGKTEVAIRAAFKAIQNKKQVALLCPTTILAQQHFNTFRERFADYPIRVEMLSRFRTAGEVKKTLSELVAGSIDMVVGTHMLLSKTVRFRDLGLVVVDEEQRFGVTHKEKLKELRASVDFLTLTATPIPRTLYMALSGLRDMSVINTPPADRHPIKTRVITWDREQIEEAILRELNRGGQVYFVHNRVQNIHQIAEKIREIVPSARLAIGHGQMNEHELEQVMLDFIDQKYDILISTTIIESGLDIPNVNTIIVNRADTFGLAQLYQLRGRVGRENRRAYAYLIVPSGQAITEQAVARLAAIEEFTELGVGFNIAMRDMEIRGTGNLLGKEQHGVMNTIGFELYCRMLEEAVEKIRGEFQEEIQRDVEIQWKVTAYIPSEFVPVEAQRVMLYKKIAEARTLEEIDEVADEMRDRYGDVKREVGDAGTLTKEAPASKFRIIEDLPEAVENLLNVARLRILGRKLSLRKITVAKGGFKLHAEDAVRALGPKASHFIKNGNPKIYTDDPNALEFFYSDWKLRRHLNEAVGVLSKL